MSSEIISKKDGILKKLIQEVLMTNNRFINYTTNDKFLYSSIIFSILKTIEDNKILFKNLIYLNKLSKIGRFSLSYTDKIFNYLENEKNNKKLTKLLSNPICIEYDDNKHIDQNSLDLLIKEFNIEISSLQFLFDKLSMSLIPIPNNILSTETYTTCYKDICLLDNKMNSEIDCDLVQTSVKKLVWVGGEDKNLYVSWCFDLTELLILLITTKINPYTNKKFKKDIRRSLTEKYENEISYCQRYVEWKNDHK